MFREKILPKQLNGWLAAAMIPTLIQYMAGDHLLHIAAAGAVSLAALWLVRRYGSSSAGWLGLLQLPYIIVLTAQMASASAGSWPTGGSALGVPLILLALAAWAAAKGISASARVGCVLFLFVLPVYLIVFGAGVGEMEYPWFGETGNDQNVSGLPLLLIPCAAATLCEKNTGKLRGLLPVLLTLCAAIVVNGVLSPKIAGETSHAFYEMSRSLNLFGVAKRFEALVSAVETVGWFALLDLLLVLCGRSIEIFRPKWGKRGVILGASGAAVWMLCGMTISARVLVILAAVFWVVIPVFVQGIEKRKKSEKSENKG